MVTPITLPIPPRPRDTTFGGDWHNGIFYQYEDGEPLAENEEQADAIVYIGSALKARYMSHPNIYVLVDMFIYYTEGDNASRFAPDVAVIFGALVKPPRNSWMVWLENDLLPYIIIEIASPSTWKQDAEEKRDLYAHLGIREYWRHDPSGELDMPILVGERLVNGRYEPIEVGSDESGVLRGHSDELSLEFCIVQDREPKLRLYDPNAQEWLLSLDEEQAARRRAESRQRQAEAEARELRRLLAEARAERERD